MDAEAKTKTAEEVVAKVAKRRRRVYAKGAKAAEAQAEAAGGQLGKPDPGSTEAGGSGHPPEAKVEASSSLVCISA